jgi:hypothetical protein
MYRSRIYRFSGSIVQFLWSVNKFYFNYGSPIYRFPRIQRYFSGPTTNTILGFTAYRTIVIRALCAVYVDLRAKEVRQMQEHSVHLSSG